MFGCKPCPHELIYRITGAKIIRDGFQRYYVVGKGFCERCKCLVEIQEKLSPVLERAVTDMEAELKRHTCKPECESGNDAGF